jgi:hypothetical protein
MIKPGQVFVRAQLPEGRWVNADVLDLDEISFRAFVLYRFVKLDVVASIKPELLPESEIDLRVDGAKLDKYRREA